MSRLLTLCEQRCRHLAQLLSLFGGLCLLLISLLTLFDIVGRWLANTPLKGLDDLSKFGVALAVSSFLPGGVMARAHIKLEISQFLFGTALTRVLDLVAAAAVAALLLLFAWEIGAYTGDTATNGETSFILHWPVAPWWIAVTLMIAVAAVMQVLVVILDLRGAVAAWGSRATPTPGQKGTGFDDRENDD